MKKKIVSLVLLVVLIMTQLSGCVWVEEYTATPTKYVHALDEAIPFVNLETAPTENKSRGFRGEVHITLGTEEGYPGGDKTYMEELETALETYKEDDMRLLQVYVYLCPYVSSELPKEALDQLKEYLEYIHSKDIKILLRFAYETGKSKEGVKTKTIEKHCKTLKSFIAENETLFHETVYAVQLGMIGLWGEGHGSIHRISVKRVIEAVSDMIPENIPLVVRTPEMLQKVPKELEYRFGVHDDFLVGYDHDWGMMHFDDENYQPLLNKCKYVVTDAEMPWGDSKQKVEMLGLLKQCAGYGLTSLSLEHNYKEKGNTYLLEQWKTEYLTKDILEENQLPYNPALLEDGQISVYNYLKHHLGYQLVASNLKMENGKASFMLTNFGFATPYQYTMHVYVDGKPVALEQDFDYKELTQFGQMQYSFPYTDGEIAIEIINTRDAKDQIQFYNDVPFENGKNIIYA